MTTSPQPDRIQYIKKLADILSRSKKVVRFNHGEEPGAWSLAVDLSDMDQSFKKISLDLLPRLTEQELSSTEIEDILLDIGEELRHILYHIHDSAFYEYLT